MSKNLTDGHILTIVQSENILEQSELQNILKERGYEISQASLSRRLKKLNIAKVNGLYKMVNFNAPYHPTILNLQISESGIIVLHTNPGNANNLAYFIDQKYVSFSFEGSNDSGVLGTIAGDDTVAVILKSKDHIDEVLKNIKKDFHI
jgi:transcriptional regulator of arginine metabolism